MNSKVWKTAKERSMLLRGLGVDEVLLDPSSLSQREAFGKKLSSRDLRAGMGLEFDLYNVEEALTGQQFRLACR